MLRVSSLLATLAMMFVAAHSETIVTDNLGNAVGLPLVSECIRYVNE